ncbi:hypothetical protein FACS1894145_2420 [Bacteroidia bacterium]|nr:hypothetical protein FACS1894145_2420 [Bacteroidia bacterium]
MNCLLEEKEKLFQNKLHSECEIFKISLSYEKIRQLSEKVEKERKCFNQEEHWKLQEEIKISFSTFIKKLQTNCPKLSSGEIVFCCLVKADIPLSIIIYCMGNTEMSALKQRKYRIRDKMRQCQCEELFDSIFKK